MDWTALLTYVAVILVVWALFKLFSWPIRIFVKLLVNTLIGGVMLFLINYFGSMLLDGFMLPVTWWSALIVGILGIPGIILLIVLTLIL